LCRVQPLVSNTRQVSAVQPNPQLELESVKRIDHWFEGSKATYFWP
jgi:hypothetical protein